MADRILYATPTARHPHLGYIQSMRAMEKTCRSFELGVGDQQFGMGPVQMARSFLAARAIDRGYDYIVFHDDDLTVDPLGQCGNPIDVWHDFFNAHEDVGAIGAVYLREKPAIPTVTLPHPDHPNELCHIVCGFPYGPLEVGGIGTGFLMIRVAAIRKILEIEQQPAPPPPFVGGEPSLFRFGLHRTEWGQLAEIGEDYDFCMRLRAAGYKVLADPRFRTMHAKDGVHLHYNWHDYETDWSDNAEAKFAALRAQCPEHSALLQIGGAVCIDHTPQRKADADEWRARIGAKQPGEQAA